ncbi:MAG: hypothetical protein ACYDB6_09375 [Candidatus Limnocylindrales bacterium]
MRTRLAQVLLLFGGILWTAAVTLAYQSQPPGRDLTPLWVGGFLSIASAFAADSAWFRGQVERLPPFRPVSAHLAVAIAAGNALANRAREAPDHPDLAWIADVEAWWQQTDALVAKHAKWQLAAFRNSERLLLTYPHVPQWVQVHYGNLQARIEKLIDLQRRLDRSA